MSLRVRFQGGLDAGRDMEFDEGRELVRFGRDPERCDVVYDAAARQVSREHFALRRVFGRYVLETNRRSPVFIDGQPGHDGQVLGQSSAIRAGVGGPIVLVEIVGDASGPVTEGLEREQPGMHTRMERMGQSVRVNRSIGALVLTSMVLGGVLVWSAIRLTRGRLAEVEAKTTEAIALSQVEISGILGDVAELERASRRFEELQKQAEGSLYLVLVRTPTGHERPHGTAWSVAPGLLATNAHVAEAFQELAAEGTLIARSADPEPFDLEITGVRLHPGYASFSTFLREFRPMDPQSGGREMSVVPACDVALLELRSEDRTRQGPPLRIASPERLHALSGGEPLALLGFPRESLVRGGFDPARPNPSLQRGNVVAISDVFLARTDEPHDALLVQHNMPISGGSSGGPVFDSNGDVVAVNSAGNFAFLDGVRVPVGGINFAQRADLVLELLEGVAASEQAERDGTWRAACESMRERGESWAFRELLASIEASLASAGIDVGGFHEVHDASTSITTDGLSGATGVSYAILRKRWLVVVAVPSPLVDLDLVAQVDGRNVAQDMQPDPFPVGLFEGDAGQDLKVVAFAKGSGQPAPAGPVSVHIKIFESER